MHTRRGLNTDTGNGTTERIKTKRSAKWLYSFPRRHLFFFPVKTVFFFSCLEVFNEAAMFVRRMLGLGEPKHDVFFFNVLSFAYVPKGLREPNYNVL